jgi:hypothetical protein
MKDADATMTTTRLPGYRGLDPERGGVDGKHILLASNCLGRIRNRIRLENNFTRRLEHTSWTFSKGQTCTPMRGWSLTVFVLVAKRQRGTAVTLTHAPPVIMP